jgi:hypothetical protein
LSPDDISIAYVHTKDDGTPNVKNIQIEEMGNLEKGLPMEFFGKDIEEAMSLRAGKEI